MIYYPEVDDYVKWKPHIKGYWNDKTTVYVDGTSCSTYQTPPLRKMNRVLEFE